MSFIGWIFAVLVFLTIAGALYKLYITAYKMPKDKMARIKARKVEMEAQDAREKEQD